MHDLRRLTVAHVGGAPAPSAPVRQPPPRAGTGPRVAAPRVWRRLESLPHVLLGYRDGDGFPHIVRVQPRSASESNIMLARPLPPGARRAGLLGHRFVPEAIGLETRVYTGWLSDGLCAPHTESGFKAPASKTPGLLAKGLFARHGVKRARAAAAARSVSA